MQFELGLVLTLLATCITLFVINRPRMDVVALLVIIIMPLLGILSVPEVLVGFSDPNVILIAALFVIGDGLVRTGITYQVGEWLAKTAGKSEVKLLVLLMLSVAGLGAFMSSTGVVAVFIPVVLSVTTRLNIAPGRLMMPLSFAGLISGMLTLVATAPNMVVDSALISANKPNFGFFSFTPIGLIILVLGIAYMLIARRWLSSDPSHGQSVSARRTLLHLVLDYHLEGRAQRLRLPSHSPLIGHTLHELELRYHYKANIIGIERRGRFGSEVINPSAYTELKPNDILLLDMHGDPEQLEIFLSRNQLESMPLQGSYFTEKSREVGMAEVALPPDSALVGKTVLELEFRRKYGVSVIGLRRNGSALKGQLLDEKLKVGDILLVIGPWKSIRQLQTNMRDFLVLSLPAEIDAVAPAHTQAPYAVACLLLMIFLMVTGLVPNVIAALIACMLMGLARCIDMESAYKSIHWQSLILIVGMMPFSTALDKTGGIELAVKNILDVLGEASPRTLIACLFMMTSVTGLFISNTATAVLMAPIALSIAHYLGVSPLPFAMTVALAASAAFMTPISSPVNTLVLGPGQYRFSDFVKVGVPFTILVLIVTTLLVPVFFPL